jgi:hypothetical protein
MRNHIFILAVIGMTALFFSSGVTGETAMASDIPENLYTGELMAYPGPWAFHLGRAHIILVSDEQLEALSDPDQVVDLSLTYDKREMSLRQLCENAQKHGHRTLIIAFDHFFAQYRPGQGDNPRSLTPDRPEYIERIAKISRFAQEYGLGLELSLLSPLELGPGYSEETGESGRWMHYRKGVRDPETGAYSVQLWRHRMWANNKGPLNVEDAGVRVFAFRERPAPGSYYRVVNPDEIVDITDTAEVDVWEDMKVRHGEFTAVRVRVHGKGGTEAKELNRVLVVQQYKTPEMDYFSETTLPWLTGLMDKYADAGVVFNGLYSDEMHIQQDWAYFNHHDHGAFALRYVSPGLEKAFAAEYGEEYGDFAKYLIYFTHGQEDSVEDLDAKRDVMHVFGPSPEAVQKTALFRARYFHFLQDGVVDLFLKAKRHLEKRMGYRLLTRAHATWAESPTIDAWDSYGQNMTQMKYEYTSNFRWSCTVHQAAAACYDYFKWGEYLTGTGNDHAEGGWLDRNYTGLVLACSTGIINEIPYSYAAHWGMPHEIHQRRQALVDAYGAFAHLPYAMAQGMQHRDTDVLMLYPIDLVAADERFGSWMTQYGYANLITQEKLLEFGRVADGAVEVAGRRFRTLMTQFEPFPAPELLAMMGELAESGGNAVWAGPPPVINRNGDNTLADWQELFGVEFTPRQEFGYIAPGQQVCFEGALDGIAPMTILTEYTVDRVYPVAPADGTAVTARVKDFITGTQRALGKGKAWFLGFRPRDDQSCSLGYEERTLFEILAAMYAYPATGVFEGVNDNPDYLCRTTDWMVCRFPNGAVAVAPHLRRLEEDWPGGFARKREEDQKLLETIDLPSNHIALENFRAAGHTVSYEGEHAVTFRADDAGNLIAFSGKNCDRITVDGKTTVFADQPMAMAAWAPVQPAQKVEGGAVMLLFFWGEGTLRIPDAGLPDEVYVIAQGGQPGSRGRILPSKRENGALVVTCETAANRLVYIVPGPAPEKK